ncbi:hypothetical protein A0J61_11187 [Choanephora cucurbitarum]|uniref:Helitron helicase-like domain-containing protein n=1 Tax=Choanephora cucurbitarum TaxID=101091 RepID=A0A1C7N088_9FUNG|nr:hypothetical protein A0J61_11187 [Choanephora cucurbitarum]
MAMKTDVLPERHNLERAEGGIYTARYQLRCGREKYVVQPFEPTPQVIAELLKNNDSKSVEFKRNIRAYNNALGFTFMGVNLDNTVQNSRGEAYAFRIHGSIYHRIGSLLRNENEQPAFAQIYVFDASTEINNRHAVANHLNAQTLEQLQSLMHGCNPIVRDFKPIAQFVRKSPNHASDVYGF